MQVRGGLQYGDLSGKEDVVADATGKYAERDLPDFSGRDWNERAFTVGIGG